MIKRIARMTAMGVQRHVSQSGQARLQVSQSGQARLLPHPDSALELLNLSPTDFFTPGVVVLLQVDRGQLESR